MQNDYEEAFRVAETARLPKEDIYKEVWKSRSSAAISFSELEEFFKYISDPEWIIQACKEAMADALSDQQRIIEYGLNACILHQEYPSLLLKKSYLTYHVLLSAESRLLKSN